jgi:hypothetical protein
MTRQLSLLGGFELRCAGQEVAVARSGQRLLALLALQARPLGRLWVAGMLWIDATEHRAGASLRSALWRLPQPGAAAVVEASTTHLRLAAVAGEPLRESAHRTLIALTSRRDVMGAFANRASQRRLATAAVALLVALNLVLLACSPDRP